MKSKNDESGIALLEFVIVVPLLFFIIFAIVDIGRALNQYLIINRIAYESLRFAVSIPNIDKPEAQLKIENRTKLLYNLHGIDPNDPKAQINSTFYSATSPDSLGRSSIISLKLVAPFEAIFLKGLAPEKVSTTITGPYLFK